MTASHPSSREPAVRATRVSHSRSRLYGERLIAIFREWCGQIILLGMWGGILVLLWHGLVIPRTQFPCWWHLSALNVCNTATDPIRSDWSLLMAIAVVGLCALPNALAFGVGLIAKWHQTARTNHCLAPETSDPTENPEEQQWKSNLLGRIEKTWNLESNRGLDAQQRMFQHAGLFGFFASTALSCCALVYSTEELHGHGDRAIARIAIAVAAAVSTSFSASLGRILVRATNRDASARMFACATRTLLAVIAGVFLLIGMLWQGGAGAEQQVIKTSFGFVLIGMVVAVLGQHALEALTSRAATLFSLPAQARPPDALELSKIEGLSAEDLIRLSEEGITTLHALAFTPTPRLYFNTPYSLECICDWQDQALLIVHAGPNRAQIFREKLVIRGAMDAQRMAEWFVSTRAQDLPEERRGLKDLISRMLGFASEQHAWESLYSLSRDETIRRLRVHWRSSIYVAERRSHSRMGTSHPAIVEPGHAAARATSPADPPGYISQSANPVPQFSTHS